MMRLAIDEEVEVQVLAVSWQYAFEVGMYAWYMDRKDAGNKPAML